MQNFHYTVHYPTIHEVKSQGALLLPSLAGAKAGSNHHGQVADPPPSSPLGLGKR